MIINNLKGFKLIGVLIICVKGLKHPCFFSIFADMTEIIWSRPKADRNGIGLPRVCGCKGMTVGLNDPSPP